MEAAPLNLMFGFTWGPGQILLVLLIIVLLFGRGKISEFMGDFAKGIKSFKKGLSDDEPATATPPQSVTQAKIDTDPTRTDTKTTAGTQTKV